MEANHLVDCSSFDDVLDVEGVLSEKNLTLHKLFALLRTWNQSVQNQFAKLIFSVGQQTERERTLIVDLFRSWTRRLTSMSTI